MGRPTVHEGVSVAMCPGAVGRAPVFRVFLTGPLLRRLGWGYQARVVASRSPGLPLVLRQGTGPASRVMSTTHGPQSMSRFACSASVRFTADMVAGLLDGGTAPAPHKAMPVAFTVEDHGLAITLPAGWSKDRVPMLLAAPPAPPPAPEPPAPKMTRRDEKAAAANASRALAVLLGTQPPYQQIADRIGISRSSLSRLANNPDAKHNFSLLQVGQVKDFLLDEMKRLQTAAEAFRGA